MRANDLCLSRRSLLRCLAAAIAFGYIGRSTMRPGFAAEGAEALKARVKAISNVFEIGRPQPDYTYVEDLGDGRGYTVTQYGFCTYTDEVTEVIERLTKASPNTPLKDFLSALPPLDDGLDMDALEGFPAVWRDATAGSDRLPQACDAVADRLFYRPAVLAVAAAAIKSPVGLAIFYDTMLQQGNGSDPDSFKAIYQRTMERTGGVVDGGEPAFLAAFLDIRRSVLDAPANSDTADVWKDSVHRVDALKHLLESNPDLIPPVHIRSADTNVDLF